MLYNKEMREIKFRAWDKKWEKMYPHNYICLSNGDFELDTEFPNGDCAGTIPKEDFILMQFTGLKDKNGKEIYEGDILEIEYKNIKYVAVVDFKDGRFYPNHNIEYDNEFKDFPVYNEAMKVIGNIYENKELLND